MLTSNAVYLIVYLLIGLILFGIITWIDSKENDIKLRTLVTGFMMISLLWPICFLAFYVEMSDSVIIKARNKKE